MPSRLLYEVNTRVWLRELSEAAGHAITLANIPESEIEAWAGQGFTHIWLMGVWNIGPLARAKALEHWRESWAREFPSISTDVQGSPYAIAEYAIDPRLGSPLDMLLLRDRLHARGLRLILDFVPNHFGLDTAEAFNSPGRFVQSSQGRPGVFSRATKLGERWFAHGRDPYFPPWDDTIQLDYRIFETHSFMTALAQTIAAYGDGMRCDMAMLLLPEVFAETWKDFPPIFSDGSVSVNLWNSAISAIKQNNPGAELIAEAYWGREEELQAAGFDFTYNKTVTDMLARGQFSELREFLLKCSPEYLARSVHFLENHDEPRAALVFDPAAHKAAALLILTLPGMPMLHDGQIEGRRAFAHIQMNKRKAENPNPELRKYYSRLLECIKTSRIREGKAEVLPALPLKPEDPQPREVICIQWSKAGESPTLVAVNLGGQLCECAFSVANGISQVELLFSTGEQDAPALWVADHNLRAKLLPRQGQIVRFRG
jgi:hypothetical protein